MKNFFLLSFILILSANVYSQKGFYFSPIIELNKWYANKDQSYKITTAQGYELRIKTNQFFFDFMADFGLHLGYRTKHYFLETGISIVNTGMGITYNIMSHYPSNSIFSNGINQYRGADALEEGGSMTFAKIPFKVGIKVFGGDSLNISRKLRWQVFCFGGLEYLFQSHLNNGYIHSVSYNIDEQGHEITISFELLQYQKLRHTLLGNVGFMVKTYTKKGRTLLNLSLDFSQSLQPHYFVEKSKVEITNYDGTTYTTYIVTRGSSMNFSISTDIYPKNWFKKKQQMDEFKKLYLK
jgi:hypothetical protein